MLTAKEARELFDRVHQWSDEGTDVVVKTLDRWIRQAIEDGLCEIPVSQTGITPDALTILKEKGYSVDKAIYADTGNIKRPMYIVKW